MSLVVLVTGSRDWSSRSTVEMALEHAWGLDRDLTVMEGGAKGADRFAGDWAVKRRAEGVARVRVPAEWEFHAEGWCRCRPPVGRTCKAAGNRRNELMAERVQGYELAGYETLVLAFKEGFDLSRGWGGTEDMVRRAQSRRLPVLLWRHPV